MKDPRIDLNPNKLVQYLDKPSEDFSKNDIIKFIRDNGIEMLNFRYPAGDGRLKTLNCVIHSLEQLDTLLSAGERVDGSSLFPYIDASSSDLYVIPRYKTAFVNPFTEIPTLDILCSYFDHKGDPLASAPENILKNAQRALEENTGYTFNAMGELEYYVFHDDKELFPTVAQKGYHESTPFSKYEVLRAEAMRAIAQAGGQIKYGHSEVGNIDAEDRLMEQHEIEFLPVRAEDAADQLVVAKWIIRNIAYRHGVNISFAPKVVVGHAGSGLHIHTMLVKNGENIMSNGAGLSEEARKVIAGYLDLAPSLTAFGNTIPLSYLRLVPHQEAPTNICWGDRNRSTLVRVPLGWRGVDDIANQANPANGDTLARRSNPQTVEFRGPDGSANIYHLIAGLAVGARHGLEMDNALEMAKKLYVDVNIFSNDHKEVREKLPQLPASCWESADQLQSHREQYEKYGVFSPVAIDGICRKLKGYDDKDFSERFYGKGDEIKKMVE